MKEFQVISNFYTLEPSTSGTLPSGIFPIAPEISAMFLFNGTNRIYNYCGMFLPP